MLSSLTKSSILTLMLLFIHFLINYYFTLYELASVRFSLNEHVCVTSRLPVRSRDVSEAARINRNRLDSLMLFSVIKVILVHIKF